MGFWDGLIRVAQGKPVFENTTEPSRAAHDPNPPVEAAGQTINSGHKIIPELCIEHCKSHIDGQSMEVSAWVTNRSPETIELDKIVMLGTTTELDRVLSPNEAREVALYKGNARRDDTYHMASLYYKQKNTGDYFQADFTIEYNYTSQKIYEVEELHPVHPIRDI